MSNVQLIQDYFGKVRKVDMAEFKALTPEERAWFADEIARERNMVKRDDGKYYPV